MSFLDKLYQKLEGKTITVIGMGVSNKPLLEVLLRQKFHVTIRDKMGDPDDVSHFEKLGATLITGENYLENITEDIIFRTPGVSPNNISLYEARKSGRTVTSEMWEFFDLCPCPIIAVTGSDGKTTTTTLIAKFLEAEGYRVFVGGNIGKPLLAQVDEITAKDYVVLELSSFQLMDMDCSPHIAVVTNLAPNHLDYHHDMEEYVEAKKQIFLHQKTGDKLILNADNPASLPLASQAVGEVLWWSRQTDTHDGKIVQDTIWIGDQPVLPLSSIQLKGVHNIENYLTALLAVNGLCSSANCESVAKSFFGVEHRMEKVREVDGVTYYNDSIGTSPSRTTAGLRSFDKRIILIAGGYDKGIPFTNLGVEIQKQVKHLVLVGKTSDAILQAVSQGDPERQNEGDLPALGGTLESVVKCSSFIEAVNKARELAVAGDDVVLSPACAAFDLFPNFAVRGNKFKEIVNTF